MRHLLIALVLVFLCALSALADKPPQTLLTHLGGQKMVHDKQCNYQAMKHVECLIYWQEKGQVVWLVLFNNEVEIILIVAVKDKQEIVVWCRNTVCV